MQLTVPELSIRVMRSAQLNELWQVWVQRGHTLLRHVVGCEELALDVERTHTQRGARGEPMISTGVETTCGLATRQLLCSWYA